MIEDFEDFHDNHVFQTDICVVGSGPAALSVASSFLNSQTGVMLIESGGETIEPKIQDLNVAEVGGLRHLGHTSGRARVLGGASKLWAGQCVRLSAVDLEKREWVDNSGWPFSLDLLAPFYRRAEELFNVVDERYDASQYERLGVAVPRWSPDSIESMFTVYTDRLDTGQFLWDDLRNSRNVVALLHANATEVVTNQSGTCAERLTLRSMSGRRATVRAKLFVIAAGGIENARLLLNSRNSNPKGLGNDRDVVGRFFQEHPNGLTATIVDGDPVLLQKLFRVTKRKGRRYFPKFALSTNRQREAQVLNCNAHLVFEYPENSPAAAMREIRRAFSSGQPTPSLIQDLRTICRNPVETAQILLSRRKTGQIEAKTSAIRLQCYLEQCPNHRSRITLASKLDALGMPKARVEWHLTGLEKKTLETMTECVGLQFRRLGLGRIKPVDWLTGENGHWQEHLSDCAHHMGTTRMADSPACGVVDRNCKLFGVDRLYIAGSSLFPTSGYANPTLTIVALAFRLSDHLKDVVS